MRFVDLDGVARLAGALMREHDLYAPQAVGGRLVLLRPPNGGDPPPIAWNSFRLAEPLKPLWLQSAKILTRWTDDGPVDGPRPRPRAIFGAKACDLRANAILDRVLRDHEFREPAWTAARERNFVVSGDCTACKASCFCTALDERPWPAEGFDLNLSPVDGGFLVEPGSERGEALLREVLPEAREPRDDEIATRELRRNEVRDAVNEQNRAWPTEDPFEKSVEKNLKTRIWGRLAATCVECNACNLVCPTCHCFLLFERRTDDGVARMSCWDSCFHAGYARMAGGGTPRLQLVERFKNHYFHKFVSFPRNWGVTACSGCGRCIDACMGRIDKRECLHRLEVEWMPSEVLNDVE